MIDLEWRDEMYVKDALWWNKYEQRRALIVLTSPLFPYIFNTFFNKDHVKQFSEAQARRATIRTAAFSSISRAQSVLTVGKETSTVLQYNQIARLLTKRLLLSRSRV